MAQPSLGTGPDLGPSVPHTVQRSSSTGAMPGRSKMDPDVANLSLKVDQHMQALTHDAVEHLLAVKARMMASLEEAVAIEQETGSSRLEAKQAEVDASQAELKHTHNMLVLADTFLDRVSGGYAKKQQAVRDKQNLLRSWYVWREWAQKRRRLQHLGLRLQVWYVHRWLLGRAWDRWLGQARLQYRTLVAERAERQRQADAADLQTQHAHEAGALRAQIESLQQQLQDEAKARNKMEEEMKRAFMRGVTAINLEALQVMRRGAPPAGVNPFPMAVPLTPSTAAAGLVAAGAATTGPEQQVALQQQDGAVTPSIAAVMPVQQAGGARSAALNNGNYSTTVPQLPATATIASQSGDLHSTLREWLPQQQEPKQPASGSCWITGSPGRGSGAGNSNGSSTAGPFAAAAQQWSNDGSKQASSQAHPALGSLLDSTAFSPYAIPSAAAPQQSSHTGFSARSAQQQAPLAAADGSMMPKVYVERGPASACSPAGTSCGLPAGTTGTAGISGISGSRSVGVRRSLQPGGADKAPATGANVVSRVSR